MGIVEVGLERTVNSYNSSTIETRPALKVETVEVLECYQSDVDNASLLVPLISHSHSMLSPMNHDDILSSRINIDDSVAKFTAPLRTPLLSNRTIWLVACLILQNFSTSILSSFRFLIIAHPCTVVYLTAVAGAGGFASSQSAIVVSQVICERESFEKARFDLYPRRLFGEPLRLAEAVKHEIKTAFRTALIVALLGYIRLQLEEELSRIESIGLSLAMFMTVLMSVICGTIIPIVLWKIGFSSAHSAALCQSLATLIAVTMSCTLVSSVARIFNP